MRKACAYLASLLALAVVALALWPAPRGLRCRFYQAIPSARSVPEQPGWRPGLLHVEHAGQRFSRPRLAQVDLQLVADYTVNQMHDASVRWQGWIRVPRSGSWALGTISDDASAVMIDDRLVSVNWGDHGRHAHWGRVELEAGWHRLRVDYVQVTGGGEIELKWKPPGEPAARVPPECLKRDTGPEPWVDAAWQTVLGRGPDVMSHLDRAEPWRRVPATSDVESAQWLWFNCWGGAHPDAIVSAGTGEPVPCVGFDAPGLLTGGGRLWRTRVKLAGTQQVTIAYPHTGLVMLWVGGALVMGAPGAPAHGPQTLKRTLPGGVTEVLAAAPACGPYPPVTFKGEDGKDLTLLLPERVPWPAPPQADAVEAPAADDGAARVLHRVEYLATEVHEHVWFWTDTRLQAPYLYRWDAKRFGHPTAIAPLLATWDGEVDVPRTGTTVFTVRSSGRAWLTIGGRTVYKDAGTPEIQLGVHLSAGRHAIRLDAHDPGVVRRIGLYWQLPSETKTRLIPPRALIPATAGAADASAPGATAADPGAADAASAEGAKRLAAGLALAAWLGLVLGAGGRGAYRRFLARRWSWHVWVVLLAAGLVVRLHDYAYVPGPGDTDDELNYHMVGMSLLAGTTPFGWTWMTPFQVEQIVPLHGRVFRIVAPMVLYPPLYSLFVGVAQTLSGATSAFEARLHVTRLVPIACSLASLALVAPVARRLGMRPAAGLLATAFLAVYPSAVVQSRLVKEENLLAPLLLATLLVVLGYRATSGAGRRFTLVGLIVAAVLTKPTGIAIPGFAVAALLWRGYWRAAGLALLAAALGVAMFAWYGVAYAGTGWFDQMQTFAAYSEQLDVLTPLLLDNTVTGGQVPRGWLAGLWIVSAATLLSLKSRHRTVLGLALASYAVVVAASYPAQYNWGWYKIPFWPVFALCFGHQGVRLMRRADPLSALLFVGLFLLPTLSALGGSVPGWPEAVQVTPLVGFLQGGTPSGWVSQRMLVRILLVGLVCPALVLRAIPRGPRRYCATLLGATILTAILVAMAVLSWHWELVYPTPMASDPFSHYENPP